MVTTVAKRIQSRLFRQGLKVTLGEIRVVYNQMVLDAETPTDEEVNAIFQHFMNYATKLTVIADEIELNPTKVEETSICVGGKIENLEATTTGETETFSQDIEELPVVATFQHKAEEAALAVQNKADLVTTTAQSMGIELQLSEVESIADHLNYFAESLDEGIAEIKQAITAFVEYKAQINQHKIDSMVDEVRHVIAVTNAETSQYLNDGLKQVTQDINQANLDFKSQVKSAIKCFAVPSIKAG